MLRVLGFLMKKDFKMMVSSKFLLFALASLVLYSCYINFVYVKIDQEIYPVYLYDPMHSVQDTSSQLIQSDTEEEFQAVLADGYSVGIDMTGDEPKVVLVTSGSDTTDRLRSAYALSMLSSEQQTQAEAVGKYSKEMKNRREITSEFLYFELAAVGFLGVAAALFKEKHMGVIRVHGIIPVRKKLFIISKLILFLFADLLFAGLLTLINIGMKDGLAVLPAVLLQTGILSVIMVLVGFFCAVRLPDFKQFSLLYLILAIFITTPVFLVGQTGVTWGWMDWHPMYHMFMALKNAFFATPAARPVYYFICAVTLILLFFLANQTLRREMAKEG